MKAEERIRRNRIRRQRQLRRRLSLFAAAVLIALSMAGGSFIVRAENASPDVVYNIIPASASGREIPCGQSRTGTRMDILNRNRISSRR